MYGMTLRDKQCDRDRCGMKEDVVTKIEKGTLLR